MTSLLEINGRVDRRSSALLGLLGIVMFVVVWQVVKTTTSLPDSLLPSPFDVLYSFVELHYDNALIRNAGFSVYLNLAGYVEALAIAVPLGFILGIVPLLGALASRMVESLRYLPLTAITGLFIAWFGIESNMKIQFLAFGIIVYLLPVVVQRVHDTDQVYVDTMSTLGAKWHHKIRYVFIPDVLSRVFDDIRVITAISWTYIIVAEVINKSEGGIGALAYTCARQARIDKVFAVLVVIMSIGFLQDKLFSLLDRWFFPHKYAGGKRCREKTVGSPLN